MLDLSHGNFSYGYGAFNCFREGICRAVGYGSYDDYVEKIISSEELSKDSIHILLQHSDCDGEITLEECKKLLPRLQEIVKNLEKSPVCDDFIESLKEAIEDNSSLYFG